ncbi:MAG: hypothetical protein MMC33_002665 [Icmadophila ericetorum]|nr:hypothetical protein [Icmadophila ericetorum]
MVAGIESIASKDDDFYAYLDETNVEGCLEALDDLETYIMKEGPFDGVMAFSAGAGFIASLMIRRRRQNPTREHLNPLFKCAIFFSGGVPGELSVDGSKIGLLSFDTDGELIEIPTAHIWGANDQLYPTFGPVLSKLCKKETRAVFIHDGGHELPASEDKQAVGKSLEVIGTTIERAQSAQ